MKFFIFFASIIFCVFCAGCTDTAGGPGGMNEAATHTGKDRNHSNAQGIATLGAGCFWSVEAVFESLRGVESVTSGYAGGHVENPTYEQVCTGETGHAEVCQLRFDPSVISYRELLDVFFYIHDPTTLNRQGADVGTQYRSVIFYHNDQQKITAEKMKEQLNASGTLPAPVVTEIDEFKNFYPAEAYHQDYYRENSSQGYCTFIIRPKMDKIRRLYGDKMKD